MAALSPNPDDFDLVVQLKQGDRAAWLRVVLEEYPRIHRLASGLVGPGDADDVTQDAFAKAMEKIEQFDGASQLGTWLYRIALNQCLLVHRERKLRAGKMKDLKNMHPSRGTGQDHPEFDEWERVRGALDRLDEESRLVLTLKHFERLSYKKIGEALGWSSKGTVAKKVQKATDRVRKLLSQSRGGGC